MTPTLEEVKKVAWGLRESIPFGAPQDEVTLTITQLQAFAQHYIEVGRNSMVKGGNADMNEVAIRNSTGE